jgi:carbon storage regulator
MLVLSRKKGEEIRIGDDIVITVHRLSGNRVSIGIQAPAQCRIVRGELQQAVEAFQATERREEPTEAKPVSASRINRMPNESAVKLGENRIAAHLARSMRAVK